MASVSIETTLALRAFSLRDVKAWIKGLFTQDHVVESARAMAWALAPTVTSDLGADGFDMCGWSCWPSP